MHVQVYLLAVLQSASHRIEHNALDIHPMKQMLFYPYQSASSKSICLRLVDPHWMPLVDRRTHEYIHSLPHFGEGEIEIPCSGSVQLGSHYLRAKG